MVRAKLSWFRKALPSLDVTQVITHPFLKRGRKGVEWE